MQERNYETMKSGKAFLIQNGGKFCELILSSSEEEVYTKREKKLSSL